MIKVCKFGGTSMADGTTIRRVRDIIESDPARRYVVVSAPGKRFGGDVKITDLLYATYKSVEETGACGEAFDKVKDRFRGIVRELGLKMDVEALLTETEQEIVKEKSEDFTASRGEYLSGRLMAEFMGVPFIDARDVVRFTGGRLDGQRTFALVAAALKGAKRAVVAGFYGADDEGRVITFSRGGSDISGAIVARATGADLYENWTDVSGFLACDPKIVDNPKRIATLSYKELRELSYMGVPVLHSDSIFPVREADIPICIKNTFRPEDEGTMILPTSKYRDIGERTITGVAGKRPFTVIYIEKSLMNGEVGFVRKMLTVLENHNISFEHVPSGIDTILLVIDDAQLKDMLEVVVEEIKAAVNPDHVRIFKDIALVTVVGHGMSGNVGAAARVFKAIAQAGVNVRLIDQGSAELDLIIGIDGTDYERAIRAVYDEFFKE